jgi:hypothetical protein
MIQELFLFHWDGHYLMNQVFPFAVSGFMNTEYKLINHGILNGYVTEYGWNEKHLERVFRIHFMEYTGIIKVVEASSTVAGLNGFLLSSYKINLTKFSKE